MMTRDLERIRFVTQHFNDLQGLRYGVPLGLITLSWGLVASKVADPLLVTALFPAAFLLMFGARRYYRTAFGEVERRPDYAAELQTSTFAMGPAPRFQSFSLRPPALRHHLTTMGTAVALLLVFLAFTPNIEIGPAPWLTLEDVGLLGPRPGRPFWRTWQPISYQAVFAQTVCVLHGSFFLGVWLRRERRWSQKHHLALGVGLLGLAAFGVLLGYLVGVDMEEIVRIINLFLPAVVRPWLALLVCGSAMILASLLDHRQLVQALGGAAASRQEDGDDV